MATEVSNRISRVQLIPVDPQVKINQGHKHSLHTIPRTKGRPDMGQESSNIQMFLELLGDYSVNNLSKKGEFGDRAVAAEGVNIKRCLLSIGDGQSQT